MAVRGRPRGNGRRRGRGGIPRTQIWEWEKYTPDIEVYNSLWRIHKAPPTITRNLVNDCPIPNATSRILSRNIVEEKTSRHYYTVRVAYHREGRNDSSGSNQSPQIKEELLEVDMSMILRYVSPRELERFENADFGAQAEAEAAAERFEVQQLARRRLEKNAKLSGRGGGKGVQPAINRLDLDDAALNDAMHAKSPTALLDELDEILRDDSGTDEEEDDEEDLEAPRPKQKSPDLMRSSFVANSALPVSPLAAPRSGPRMSISIRKDEPDDFEIPESDLEEDTVSMSSAAAQLQFETDAQDERLPFLDGDKDQSDIFAQDRHRSKRRRTESGPASRKGSSRLASQGTDDHSVDPSQHRITYFATNPSLEGESSEDEIPARAPSRVFEHRHELESADNAIDASSTREDNENSEDDAEEYVVEAILDHSYDSAKQKYYLVKWQGFEDSSDWLPVEDLEDAPDLVKAYEANFGMRFGSTKPS
ncbi:hypothetical protein BS50DRAFT_206951 [Corynespora cassiicola Philippines]|uniref:Chromo domain-containing protein n=1 Tax=Corynespora cassiicola Philippines TaxID=1448308 RepID=A0A2T2N4F8_CORCC|nr:hypothetical protein BS50DRAFT_206951 [Corynespora cassiicola Philippines]